VPEHVGSGRFMKLLESAPDWAISRTRYWGAPLPVWRHSKTKEIQVAGSVDDLLRLVRRSGNNYFIMRHGQSDHNVAGCVHDDDTRPSHLTDVGRQEARAAADMLKDKKIDYIVVSPLVRAQETAQIVRSAIGLAESSVMTDERLRETGVGIFNGKTMEEWKGYFSSRAARFETAPPQGESYADIRRRVGEFLFDIEQRYTGKNILIVSHGDPLWLMYEVAARTSTEVLRAQEQKTMYLNTAECRELSFVPYPHNANFELDLHRPYIDEIPMGNVLEGRWERVPDVFDCWFESGSMPFASNGYPTNKQHFDPKRWFGFAPKGYPADFIAESIDQTRGWFYSMLVLSTALFGKSAYKAVVTNGLILAEDGRKMSKKLKNYPDPMEVVEKYGADSLRYYLLSSAVIRGEDLRFSERGVDEVSKKLLMRLDNVRSFYEMYAGGQPMLSEETLVASSHVLDQWILSRLAQLVRDATLGYETYQLDAATRPLLGFVDDLSNWYVRRSRDRFKTDGADKQAALTTLREVLFVVSHVMAPVMPFYADDLYKRVMHSDGPASVHLSDWPTAAAPDDTLVADMALVRDTSSRALQLREKAGIKIRQPLARLSVKTLPSNTALHALIADEANVKAVTQDATIADDVVLDTTLTPELRDEGLVRDLVRMVQDLRKKEGLTIGDRPQLTVATNAEGKTFINKHTAQLSKETGLRAVHTEEGGSAVKDFEYPVDLSLQL
jgi:isoleucyl-tRNA synthetase